MINNTLRAQDFAAYLLTNVDVESGDSITNLKLQKLLYYAQGFHLAMSGGEPLFPENILAWNHGPVVRAVWSRYKDFEWRSIDPPSKHEADDVAPEQREILDAVYAVYGQFTGTRLEDMTQKEPPWQTADRNSVISIASIAKYFVTLVDAARNGKEVPGHPLWPINSFRFQGRKEISASMAPYRERLRAVRTRKAARGPR